MAPLAPSTIASDVIAAAYTLCVASSTATPRAPAFGIVLTTDCVAMSTKVSVRFAVVTNSRPRPRSSALMVGGEASAIVVTPHEYGEQGGDAGSTTERNPGLFDPWSLLAT